MKTLTDATLYTVKGGPRGTYYAVRNNETGRVLTERTESAAAAIANEQDLVIVDQLEMQHTKLLEMMAAHGDDDPLEATALPLPGILEHSTPAIVHP